MIVHLTLRQPHIFNYQSYTPYISPIQKHGSHRLLRYNKRRHPTWHIDESILLLKLDGSSCVPLPERFHNGFIETFSHLMLSWLMSMLSRATFLYHHWHLKWFHFKWFLVVSSSPSLWSSFLAVWDVAIIGNIWLRYFDLCNVKFSDLTWSQGSLNIYWYMYDYLIYIYNL